MNTKIGKTDLIFSISGVYLPEGKFTRIYRQFIVQLRQERYFVLPILI